MGVQLSDLPLYRNFWSYTPYLKTPLHYVSVMSLTFEMANLDFAPLYGASFAKQGDYLSAQLMQQILQDELSHVSFGYRWLKKLKGAEQSEWDAWVDSLPPKLTPDRAKGFQFMEEHRSKIGISSEWINNLKQA